MISALQSKLQTINSTIQQNTESKPQSKASTTVSDVNISSSPLSSLGIIEKQFENTWHHKKYAEQLELLVNFFTIKYPSHPDDLISISCKGLLDKLITFPEKSEDIIILSEKGDRIIDLRNITWKKRRTLIFQFCKTSQKNICSENEIDCVRKKIRELFSLTELHLIED